MSARKSSSVTRAAALAASLLVLLALAAPATATPLRRLAGSQPHARHLQQASSGPCAINSNPAPPFFGNASVTCLELWPAPSPPIRVPNDTATVKYGILSLSTMFPITAKFVDRFNNEYPVLDSANPPDDSTTYLKATPLVVVKVTLNANSSVTSWSPEIYVPYSTIMATMRDTQFEGLLYNSAPRPAGPNETSWFRWTMSNVVTVDDPTAKYDTLLMGTFDNLFRSVKDSTGACRPALCSDPTFQSPACRYYTQYFGNTTNAMTLNWDPNMHFADDTELVPMFPSMHRQYMARFMNLNELLKPWAFVPKTYTFICHGTPMGVPQNFTGTLSPAATKLQYC